MGTRYGRRAASGNYEYHDSLEALNAAAERESSRALAGWFGLFGLLAGGVLTYLVLHKFGVDWPRWLRFTLVIAGSGVLAYTLARFANLLWAIIVIGALLVLASGLGALLWKAV
ncbi:hypothetical protein HH212_00405 [Massilia forsythiae]|uniref:Uncharacterized protein n=1 Tax=Massilia forsythiae TaxID=2728020 RepID=A0A7Z2ZR16_9BURK|nr:hypothetical protein [Massilia forsythiae]QJD98688.1 hypothetical protein HH212_00405 [Massilia forsythiae]